MRRPPTVCRILLIHHAPRRHLYQTHQTLPQWRHTTPSCSALSKSILRPTSFSTTPCLVPQQRTISNQAVHMAESSTVSSSSSVPVPPPITHILETCLMVNDIKASTEFYKTTFNIAPFMDTPRMSGFALGQTTLLLFQLGATAADSPMPDDRGTIPGHGPSQDILDLLKQQPSSAEKPRSGLHQHFCLAVKSPDDVTAWEKWFEDKNIKITGKVNCPRGGKSVYFADPDGNVGEVGSRGIWEHY